MQMCHPFDGDGLICSFAIKQGEVLARRKFVRTQDMQKEMAAGEPLPSLCIHNNVLCGRLSTGVKLQCYAA
jgi:carotenoid cleavage dioxygenase-like enzyme